jgi:hypothetical protein
VRGHECSFPKSTQEPEIDHCGDEIMLLEEERENVERRHETSPLLHVWRALPSSATRDLSPQFNGVTVAMLVTSTASINQRLVRLMRASYLD